MNNTTEIQKVPEAIWDKKKKYIESVKEEVYLMLSKDAQAMKEAGISSNDINYELYKKYRPYCNSPFYVSPIELENWPLTKFASKLVDSITVPRNRKFGAAEELKQYKMWDRWGKRIYGNAHLVFIIGGAIGWLLTFLIGLAPALMLNSIGFLSGFFAVFFGLPIILITLFFIFRKRYRDCSKDIVQAFDAIKNGSSILREEYNEILLYAKKELGGRAMTVSSFCRVVGLPYAEELFGDFFIKRIDGVYYKKYFGFYKSPETIALLALYANHYLDKIFPALISECACLKGFTSDTVRLYLLEKYPWLELPPFIKAYNGEQQEYQFYGFDADVERIRYLRSDERDCEWKRLSDKISEGLLRYYTEKIELTKGLLITGLETDMFPTLGANNGERKYNVEAIDIEEWLAYRKGHPLRSFKYVFEREVYYDTPFDVGEVVVKEKVYNVGKTRLYEDRIKKYKVVHANYEDFAKFRAQNT